MKNLVTILLFILFVNTNASDLDGVNFNLKTGEENNKVILTIENKTAKALVCSGVKISAELEDYETYTDIGSVNTVINDTYIAGEWEKRDFEKSFFEESTANYTRRGQVIIVKNLAVDTTNLKCREANFLDYCRMSNLNEFEKHALAALGKSYDRSSCYSVYRKIKRKRSLDLSDTDIADFRFLQFFPKVKEANLTNTYQDRSLYLNINKEIKIIGDETRPTLMDYIGFDEFQTYIMEENRNITKNFKYE